MQWQYKNISTSFRPLFIPQVPKSVEFVRMRGKTDEKIVLTDLRFRVRTRATQADRWGLLVSHNEDTAGLFRDRVGAVTRENYEDRKVPPANCLQGRVQPRAFLCSPFQDGELH